MKIFKIILINTFAFFILALILDMLSALNYTGYIQKYCSAVYNPIPVETYFESMYARKPIDRASSKEFRPDKNTDSNKQPILLMGDSFTYGARLNEKDCLSAKLSELIQNPIYNRACNGWGLPHLLYQLRDTKIYEQIQEPKYLIYLIVARQLNGIDKFKVDAFTPEFQPKYKVKMINNEPTLTEVKPKFLETLFSIQGYQFFNSSKIIEKNYKKYNVDTIELYFQEAQKAMRKHWKNTQFVIILYPTEDGYDDIYKPKRLNKLEQSGFKIIDIQKLTNVKLNSREYKIEEDNNHPNADAIEIVAPLLVKELNL